MLPALLVVPASNVPTLQIRVVSAGDGCACAAVHVQTLSSLPFGGAQTEYHADRIRPLLYAYNDLLAASGWED
jgi:hypothetical protein